VNAAHRGKAAVLKCVGREKEASIMRAYELTGIGVERIAVARRPEPTPGPGEVLLRMRAASLNARDQQIVMGHYPVGKPFPLVLLSDGVGEVVALGKEVTRVKRGDRVAGIFAQRWLSGPRTPATWCSTLGGDLDGTLQESMVLHEDGVVAVPPHLTDEEAATLPTAAVTAWQALVTRGRLKAGDTVLVQGTGAVALFALQFALMCGARVIVTSQSAAKRERAKQMGAAEVVDRNSVDWVGRVRDLTRDEGVAHVIDVSGDLAASLACLKIGGTISVIGYLAKTRIEADLFPLLLSNARLFGITVGPRSTFEEMNRAIAVHEMRPIVGQVIPFDRASEAFAALSSKDRFGKVVVKF
jgi:NADPH:quinone reductase-like Zn-dependent oxidoreductase